MAEPVDERVHTEHAVLDIGENIGALIIYTAEELRGKEIEVRSKSSDAPTAHSAVLERRVNGRALFAALFLALPEGSYATCSTPSSEVTIVGGQVSELDWRESRVVVHPPVPHRDRIGP